MTWEPNCPACESPHGFASDTADATCPHCGVWLTARHGVLIWADRPNEQSESMADRVADDRYERALDRRMGF